ncbi:MAG: hypothetical protein KH339_06325 [Firmicutes bacterium]|nr:hypothetical protein [Bacillota bacterium]
MIRGKTLRNTLLVLAALALAVFLAVSFGLFSPSAHMWPNRVEGGQLYYTRHNCTLAYTPGGGSSLLKLPWDRGGEAPDTYTVGERSFTLSEDGTQLLENGKNLVPEGLGLFASRLNAQPDSLIVPLSDARGNEAGRLCLTTDHSRVLDGSIEPLCAAGRWAYGVGQRGDEAATLYCMDLETGETRPLTDEASLSLALTDGRWLYTYRMWGTGSASCWEITCDAEGRPEALDYVGEV